MTYAKGKRLTFEQRIHSFPPILLRLLARDDVGRPLDTNRIVEKAGSCFVFTLKPSAVEYLSQETDWTDSNAIEVVLFTRGCGVDFCNGNCSRADDYLWAMSQPKRKVFEYLRRAPNYNEFYLPLIIRWRRAYPETPPESLWPPVRRILTRLTPLLKP